MLKYFMKILISIVIFNFSGAVYALPEVLNENNEIQISASKAVYQGNECLLFEIKRGLIPVNAPARILRVYSDEINNYKTFKLKQIDLGKFVTIGNILFADSIFTLRFPSFCDIKAVQISFQEPKKKKK